jgi:hypothetical protein
MKWLNLIVQAQAMVPVDGFAFEDAHEEINILVLGHPWRNLHGHCLLMNYLCFGDYLSIYPCVPIH